VGKKKVIIDTNILVSALGWGGNAYEIVNLGFAYTFEWIISKPMFEELIKVLNYPKLDFIDREEKEKFISSISESAKFVETENKSVEFIDPKDEMFLECALYSDVDYIVSGDKQLLNLKEIGKSKIVSPIKFLSIFKKRQ